MGNISLKKGQVLKASTVHFYPNFHLAVPSPPPPHPSTLLVEVSRVVCLSRSWFVYAPFSHGAYRNQLLNRKAHERLRIITRQKPCKRETSAYRQGYITRALLVNYLRKIV